MISRRTLLSAILGLLAGCGDKSLAFRNTNISGGLLDADWALSDCAGRLRRSADFHGKVVILFFGYATCPDICPTALAKYAALLRRDDLPDGAIKVIFVSLDPERDTPQRLCEYLAWFHPDIVGLTGNVRQIDVVARKFRVTRQKKESPGSMVYVIDHTAGAYVLDPQGRARLYLAENARLEDIVADIRQLLAGG
jgi:protein SCO1/2